MRILAALLIPVFAYMAFTKIAMDHKPLNAQLAYEALVTQLRKTEAGRHAIDLSETTLMQRDNELIFFGRGQVRRKDQIGSGMPLIERYDFQYIGVMSRICTKWQSECYEASELEVSGTKQAVPMI